MFKMMSSNEKTWVFFEAVNASEDPESHKNLCIMYFKIKGYYQFYVTDLITVWRERIKVTELGTHMKNFSSDNEEDLLKNVFEFVKDPNARFTFEDHVPSGSDPMEMMGSDETPPKFKDLVLTKKLRLISLFIKLRLKETGPAELHSLLTVPLLLLLKQSRERERLLMDKLAAKDKEIDEYKSTGAKLSRRVLETTVFDAAKFSAQAAPLVVAPDTMTSSCQLLASTHGYDQVCSSMLQLNLLGDDKEGSTPITSPVGTPANSPPPSPQPKKARVLKAPKVMKGIKVKTQRF